jgi:nucleotide-binding universal stress UspA family protein
LSESSKRIVVGVDGSEHADRALTWAIEEAKLRDARVEVVTAWHLPPMMYGAAGLMTPPVADGGLEESAKAVAGSAAERVREAGLTVDTAVRLGQAANVLVEEAADADLLVVGSRGHGGFAGLLLGSVSGQCSHHAPCPVVIVR